MQAVVQRGDLSDAGCIDLVTYRRDGTPVSTPVLSTPNDGVLLVRTHVTAGKLKRLRLNPTVEVAPCNGRGRRLGESVRGTARILSESESVGCLDLLHRRHGLVGRASTWLRHRYGPDVFIEVRIA